MWAFILFLCIIASFAIGAWVIKTKLQGVWTRLGTVQNALDQTTSMARSLQSASAAAQASLPSSIQTTNLSEHLRALEEALRIPSSDLQTWSNTWKKQSVSGNVTDLLENAYTVNRPLLLSRVRMVREVLESSGTFWSLKDVVQGHRAFLDQLLPVIRESRWADVSKSIPSWAEVQTRAADFHGTLNNLKTLLVLVQDELRHAATSLDTINNSLAAVIAAQAITSQLLTHAHKLSAYVHALTHPLVPLLLQALAQTRVTPVSAEIKDWGRPALETTRAGLQAWEQVL
jgi:hypothetical protein